MKFKNAFLGGVLAAVICLSLGYIFKDKPTDTPLDDSKYEQVMDSLNKEVKRLEITNDSLVGVISNSETQIDTINHWYEKEFTNITNQSIAADVRFFTEYISEAGK